jgi:hypothetical protein
MRYWSFVCARNCEFLTNDYYSLAYDFDKQRKTSFTELFVYNGKAREDVLVAIPYLAVQGKVAFPFTLNVQGSIPSCRAVRGYSFNGRMVCRKAVCPQPSADTSRTSREKSLTSTA